MADLNELKKYTKDEIINALNEEAGFYPRLVTNMVRSIERKRENNLFVKQEETTNKLNEAFQEYMTWKEKVIKEYGKNGVAKLKDIPLEVLKIGAEKEKKIASLRNQDKTIDKKIRKALNL